MTQNSFGPATLLTLLMLHSCAPEAEPVLPQGDYVITESGYDPRLLGGTMGIHGDELVITFTEGDTTYAVTYRHTATTGG